MMRRTSLRIIPNAEKDQRRKDLHSSRILNYRFEDGVGSMFPVSDRLQVSRCFVIGKDWYMPLMVDARAVS